MRRNRFLLYGLILVAVIGAVIWFFRIVPDKKMASVYAGILFVVVPLALLLFEVRRYQLQRRLWIFSVLQFWLLFALPIMALRLLYWEEDFASLSVMGVQGSFLHSWSSKSYMLMLIITWLESIRLYRQGRKTA